MRLPQAVYDQVLEGLGLDPKGLLDRRDPGAQGVEPERCQRRSFRRRLSAPAHYFRHGAADPRPNDCTLVDLSRDGVCVMVNAVVAPGERFVLHLPRAGEDGAGPGVIALLCTARSSRLKSDGRFRTGAEFTDPAEAGDGAAALSRSADGLTARGGGDTTWARTGGRPAARDLATRRSDRHESAGVASMYLYRDDGSHGEPEDVQLRDYSESGVAVLRHEPLKVGEQFVVRVPRGDERPITRLCRVMNVAVAGGRYRIGAEFIPFPGPSGRGFFSRLKEWIA
jgi:hypothetical protein